jgi:hypothetical protein
MISCRLYDSARSWDAEERRQPLTEPDSWICVRSFCRQRFSASRTYHSCLPMSNDGLEPFGAQNHD